MSSKSTTIRVTSHARDTVREIAEITGKRQQEVVDEAVEAYRRQVLLETANEAYAALGSDGEAWQAEQEEREAWDATLADGAEKN